MYQIYDEKERKVWLENDMRERELTINGRGDTERVPSADHTIISKPKHQLGLTTFSEYIDKAREIADFRIEQSLWKDEIKIDIKTPNKWFGIQPWGDFHMGSHGCDYDMLEELLAGITEHDNLKTLLLSNIGDFFTPIGSPRDGSLGDVFPIQQQMFAIKKFMTEFQDEILASVNSPDHEDWVYRSSGIDIYEYMLEELDIPLVTAGGSVKINFGEIEYDIMPFHKISKFKSEINRLHAHNQALRFHRDADVVMAGHTHKPAFGWFDFNKHDVELVQIGTLETKETGGMYGKKEGFLGRVRSVYPVVLFNTIEKDMIVVKNLKQAEPYLDLK